ncbi:hypothetical protein Zmor_000998 [Zophobas morio]|uniref:Reverse transcriptase domain-containing protein n=1 Tax=Zophobas morio TaxID=2755281 RepID=A0AA38J1S4_9CUCU|nr:hypothetical protein Zmor_000998 [Zophobas morio]
MVEITLTIINNSLMSAYEKSFPLKKEGLGKGTPWWNRRLSLLQSWLRKLFNRAKNTKKTDDWKAYKEHRKEFKKKLRKRKWETWRSFCSDITSTASAARLKRVLSKDHTHHLGFLKKEDGTFTATLEESAELLLQTMFPGSTRTTSHSKRDVADTQPSPKDWAVGSFSPYNSPGVDGIYPALLQRGMSRLRPILLPMLRACLAFSYIPNAWQKVKVIFIPKPGRQDYTLAKSYRPISLTSFLLKTLERLSEKEIRETALSKQLLHPNQHAYIQGRSTDTDLHIVVNRIEWAMENKLFTLGMFLDVEGAFYKTTFKNIGLALQEHDVNPTLSRWMAGMLRNREVPINIGGNEIEAVVGRGCPQGGVLSPVLWDTVVDSLIRLLNDLGYHTIGYADDLVILLTGKNADTVCKIMQAVVKIVEEWCRRLTLSVNGEKTKLILFTRKRKIGTLQDANNI